MKKALITGITGQDGSYLAELLLSKGYEVHGIVRRASSFNRDRIDHLCVNPDIKDKSLFLHYGDMTDSSGLSNLKRIIVSAIKVMNVANPSKSSRLTALRVPTLTATKNIDSQKPHLSAERKAFLYSSCGRRRISTNKIPSGTPSIKPSSMAGMNCCRKVWNKNFTSFK